MKSCYNHIMTFTEEFEQLLEDSDIMIISGNVGTKINDINSPIAFLVYKSVK